MSDFETTKAMLVQANIPHVVDEYLEHYIKDLPDARHAIEVQNGPTLAGQVPGAYKSTTVGYAGCESVWCFDKDGKLLAVGHYKG